MSKAEKKSVLILGAGLVTRPAVRYLSNAGFSVTVASRTVSKAESLVSGLADAQAVPFTIDQKQTLEALVSKASLTISLLPAAHHVEVAETCLRAGRPMVTTSYVKPEMKRLDAEARKASLLLLNEVGLDPGIDHMSAMKIFHHVADQGGKVVGFKSYCGGLPAPDANTNPWGYKFSWSPKGVVLAGTNAARFREAGRQVEVPGPELFAHHWPVDVPDLGRFEGYPNRDSLSYLELYGLSDMKTMFRGTLRYPGWCDAWKHLVDLGLLDQTPRDDLAKLTYRRLMASFLPAGSVENLEEDLARYLSVPRDGDAMHRFEWLGLFKDEPLPFEPTVLDVMCHRLQEKLQYARGERDLIILHHEFDAEFGKRRQKITSTLIDYGIPGGDSAMARTVSLPAAIGARLILQGKISLTGVRIPVDRELYEPILEELAREGVKIKETFMDVS